MAGELNKNFTTLHGDVEQTTGRAIRMFGDWGQEVWIPVSVIEGGEDVEEGSNQDLNVETWWCKKEGLD